MFKNIVYKIISCYRPIRLNDLGGHLPKEISKVYRVFKCLLHTMEMAALCPGLFSGIQGQLDDCSPVKRVM